MPPKNENPRNGKRRFRDEILRGTTPNCRDKRDLSAGSYKPFAMVTGQRRSFLLWFGSSAPEGDLLFSVLPPRTARRLSEKQGKKNNSINAFVIW